MLSNVDVWQTLQVDPAAVSDEERVRLHDYVKRVVSQICFVLWEVDPMIYEEEQLQNMAETVASILLKYPSLAFEKITITLSPNYADFAGANNPDQQMYYYPFNTLIKFDIPLQTIQTVVAALPDKSLLASTDGMNLTPLHFACLNYKDALSDYLARECPEALKVIDCHDQMPLHIACESAAEHILQYMVKTYPDALQHRYHLPGGPCPSPLLAALRYGRCEGDRISVETIKLFIDLHPEGLFLYNHQDRYSNAMALAFSTNFGWSLELAQYMIEKFPGTDIHDPKYGNWGHMNLERTKLLVKILPKLKAFGLPARSWDLDAFLFLLEELGKANNIHTINGLSLPLDLDLSTTTTSSSCSETPHYRALHSFLEHTTVEELTLLCWSEGETEYQKSLFEVLPGFQECLESGLKNNTNIMRLSLKNKRMDMSQNTQNTPLTCTAKPYCDYLGDMNRFRRALLSEPETDRFSVLMDMIAGDHNVWDTDPAPSNERKRFQMSFGMLNHFVGVWLPACYQ